ncbi:unnamed protein product [Brassicogethes aeneus]|uniref:LysM domain-containing protein n=1 Tax=Brassicogethes aeneus TaxID=1431903 RepID=A0A9P0B0S1_BRAAE|nr:unnamed protein product [Brassicogethes aeneus]
MMIQRQKMKKYVTEYKKVDKDSDEETELLRLKTPKKEIPSIAKEVEENDTLQSLAIRYNCTIEDLKRLNGIQKENEIFAKRTIKVPYRPFTMAIGTHVSGKSSPSEITEEIVTSNLIDLDQFHTELNKNLESLLPKEENELEVNNIIFNSNLKSNKYHDVQEEQLIDYVEEEVNLLPQIEELPTATLKLKCSGADGDISWIALIICIGVVIVAVPLIYVFYIAEHPEKYQHNPTKKP